MRDLPRKWILVDKRGRITLPKYLLLALGVDIDNSDEAPLIVVEAHPTLEKTTCLTIKRG